MTIDAKVLFEEYKGRMAARKEKLHLIHDLGYQTLPENVDTITAVSVLQDELMRLGTYEEFLHIFHKAYVPTIKCVCEDQNLDKCVRCSLEKQLRDLLEPQEKDAE